LVRILALRDIDERVLTGVDFFRMRAWIRLDQEVMNNESRILLFRADLFGLHMSLHWATLFFETVSELSDFETAYIEARSELEGRSANMVDSHSHE
jgi:hypothetical protein